MRERRELLNQLFARLEGELLKFREEKAYATWIASRVKNINLMTVISFKLMPMMRRLLRF